MGFKEEISNLVNQASVFVSDAKDKTMDFLEEKQFIFELTSEIKAEKAALEELYCTYGKVMYASGNMCECAKHGATMAKKLSAEIANKKERIEALEEELEQFKKASERNVEPEKVFCTTCGKEFSGEEEYCNKCGSKLNRD